VASKSEFDQQKREVPDLAAKIVVQVRSGNIWVGLLATPDSAIAETTRWTKAFKRPEGKSALESAERAFSLAMKAIESGALSQPSAEEDEPW